jgi:hypothetical protein
MKPTLTKTKIVAIANSDKEAGIYAVYGDNQLFLVDVKKQEITFITKLPNLQTIAEGLGDGRLNGKELEINIIFHHPYVCVFERLGLNAALVNLETVTVKELKREDYHCDVSSFSIAFIERDSRTLLIKQSQWNRLDIIDIESWENITEREVWIVDTGQKDELGHKIVEKRNYLDYFHSRLHVSPDYNYFLSDGWVWHPVGIIFLFSTTEFLKSFETGRLARFCQAEYNWDRPCTFIDNNTFVVIMDDEEKTGIFDEEQIPKYEYFQLAFFKTNSKGYTQEPYRRFKCSAFKVAEYGDVVGALFYNQDKDYLIGITAEGTFAISMTGEILATIPEAVFKTQLFKAKEDFQLGWSYSPQHNILYTWQDGIGVVEKHFDI